MAARRSAWLAPAEIGDRQDRVDLAHGSNPSLNAVPARAATRAARTRDESQAAASGYSVCMPCASGWKSKLLCHGMLSMKFRRNLFSPLRSEPHAGRPPISGPTRTRRSKRCSTTSRGAAPGIDRQAAAEQSQHATPTDGEDLAAPQAAPDRFELRDTACARRPGEVGTVDRADGRTMTRSGCTREATSARSMLTRTTELPPPASTRAVGFTRAFDVRSASLPAQQ